VLGEPVSQVLRHHRVAHEVVAVHARLRGHRAVSTTTSVLRQNGGAVTPRCIGVTPLHGRWARRSLRRCAPSDGPGGSYGLSPCAVTPTCTVLTTDCTTPRGAHLRALLLLRSLVLEAMDRVEHKVVATGRELFRVAAQNHPVGDGGGLLRRCTHVPRPPATLSSCDRG
jgi:hypothetical protein